ncbi:leucine-rich repeat-containing protein 20 isoform 1-T1 [Sarcophilus harrisii]|uniref:Leucine rich repeat containing 20 n=1 Tax=Sarcophilus harrisii TaxID=9305 RepID=A0A7N4PKU8_SARHA
MGTPRLACATPPSPPSRRLRSRGRAAGVASRSEAQRSLGAGASLAVPASPSRTTRWRCFSDRKDWVCMLKKMGEAVARVARKVNETVENDSDTLDLAECKLVSFPVGIYKVLWNVAEHIRLIILANNELQALTSKFMSTFSQLQELNLEGNALRRLPDEISTLQHLKAINLARNQFQDFPEKLTALRALETINLEKNAIVDVPVEKLAAMPALRSVNLQLNPLSPEVRAIARPLIKFDLLVSPEGARSDSAQ